MLVDRYSKIALTAIAVALALIAIPRLQPPPVAAQQSSAELAAGYQVASPERDFAWVVSSGGAVWFCQSSFRGTESGCEAIDPAR